MFKKKDDEGATRRRSAKNDPKEGNHAYEDSWYRSLKALAEAREASDDQGTIEENTVADEIPDPEAVED